MTREWPPGTVIFHGMENSDEGLIRYFNPSTRWKLLQPKSIESLDIELADIYSKGGTAWFETTAIDQFAATPEGLRWLEAHARKGSLKELNDAAYKIRFVQVVPAK